MPRPLDPEDLMMRARRWLATGALSGTELGARLGVSQPTVSRLLAQHRDEILTTGRARRTLHVLRRRVADVETPAPLFEIDPDGSSRRIAWLHPIGVAGFHVESTSDEVDTRSYDDWPWFLHQLRPGGFLGRRMAEQNPSLGLPEEPRSWSADQLLRYLNHHGSSGSGALVVGRHALAEWLRDADSRRTDESAESLYPRLASNVLAGAPPGSSAEGEQPKFLVARSVSRPDRLVKFSPNVTSTVGRRIADLLIAEHHALEALTRAGMRAASSTIVESDERVFLETTRFDRTEAGRVGLLSLEAFDLEFVGDGGRGHWPSIARRLVEMRRVPASILETVDRLHAFGHLIGNDDMHTGNLSFVVRGHRALDVAPAYDMSPTRFAPLRSEILERDLVLSPGAEVSRVVWNWAQEAALDVWRAVGQDDRISTEFRSLAKSCIARVEASAAHVRRLPE